MLLYEFRYTGVKKIKVFRNGGRRSPPPHVRLWNVIVGGVLHLVHIFMPWEVTRLGDTARIR